MLASKARPAVGFPPPLMGELPLRLPILGQTEDWLAIEKPAGHAVRQHPWNAKLPDLDSALNQQLNAGKPELVALGATLFGSVYYLDPEVSGVTLFGKSRESLAQLRNSFGAGEFCCRFILVANETEADGENRESTAPLLPHRVKPKMIPSTAKGKKCRTRFRRLGQSRFGWSLWSAETDFFRPHQVRAHAPLVGLSVMGDALYDGAPAPALGTFRKRGRGPGLQRPVFSGPAIHLAGLCAPAADMIHLVMQPPKPWGGLLKMLELAEPVIDMKKTFTE